MSVIDWPATIIERATNRDLFREDLVGDQAHPSGVSSAHDLCSEWRSLAMQLKAENEQLRATILGIAIVEEGDTL